MSTEHSAESGRIDNIPAEIEKFIDRDVETQLARMKLYPKLFDPEDEDKVRTYEYYKEVVRDQEEAEFLFLEWVQERINPRRVLYPGPGYDEIPKHVFGEERLVSLSLEDYLIYKETGEKGKQHFLETDPSIRVIGEATEAPFKDNSFDLVFLQGISPTNPESLFREVERVTKNGGLIIISEVILYQDTPKEPIDLLRKSKNFKEIEVPQELQLRGISESEFFVFEKIEEKELSKK